MWSYHVKGDESIELYKPMEIAKDDGDGEENDIAGVAKKQAHQFDDLGKGKHVDELSPKGILPAL